LGLAKKATRLPAGTGEVDFDLIERQDMKIDSRPPSAMVQGVYSGDPTMNPTPSLRLHTANRAPLRGQGAFVLYWMSSARRTGWNWALQHAVGQAESLRRALLIVETLPCDRPRATVRQHHFALDGMADNAHCLADRPVGYYPFVERRPGEIAALLEALATDACLVVGDLHPLCEERRATTDLAARLAVRLERVDGNGLLPLAASESAFATAYALRRFLQRELPGHLLDRPLADPLAWAVLPPPITMPPAIARRWPAAGDDLLGGRRAALKKLPIEQGIGPVAVTGGGTAARAALETFLNERLHLYQERRNEPEQDVTSGLSPYLRWGHMASAEIVQRVLEREDWTPGHLSPETRGKRSGWWGLSADAEAFLDQLITWRELGYLFCRHHDNYDRFESLPDWARRTLREHEDDPRPELYDPATLEAGRTADPLWNAAQMQLVREGRMHNYLRMLWGKKILQWSPTPEQALAVMIDLNDRYALDGRDPNSYSGIGWVLGRFDRAWGPQRPIFGKIRYMSSRNTARKVAVKNYIRRYRP